MSFVLMHGFLDVSQSNRAASRDCLCTLPPNHLRRPPETQRARSFATTQLLRLRPEPEDLSTVSKLPHDSTPHEQTHIDILLATPAKF